MRRSLSPFSLALVVLLAACSSPAVPPQANYATIYGTVTDGASGRPIAGAVVTVSIVLASAPTKDDGGFTIANVPSGPTSYSVSAPGYAGTQGPVTLDSGQRLLLNVSLNK